MNIQDLFPGASTEDFRLYLDGTIMQLRESEKSPYKLVEIVSISDEAINYLDFETKKQKKIELEKNCDLDFVRPELGFYSVKRTTVFLSRLTERQNKKGLCSTTYRTTNLMFPLLHQATNILIGGGMVPAIPKHITKPLQLTAGLGGFWEILSTPKRFFALPEAASRIAHRLVFARALTPFFALSAGFKSAQPFTLWYHDIPIGFVDNDLKITISEHLFFQEAFDIFGSQYEVHAT